MKKQAQLIIQLLFLTFSLFAFGKVEAQESPSYSSVPSSSNQQQIEPYVLNLSFTEEDKVALGQAKATIRGSSFSDDDGPRSYSHEGYAKNGDCYSSEWSRGHAPCTIFQKKAIIEITLERGQDLIIQSDNLDNLTGYVNNVPIDSTPNSDLLITDNDWLYAPLKQELDSSSPFKVSITNHYKGEWNKIHDINWTLSYFIPKSVGNAQDDITKTQQVHIHLK